MIYIYIIQSKPRWWFRKKVVPFPPGHSAVAPRGRCIQEARADMQDHRSQGDGRFNWVHWIWTLCADLMSTAYRTKQKKWMVSNYEK